MQPLVSIVTPSLNQGRFLREALESVAAQTYSPIEHVVVDGGSTDDTLEILHASGVRFVSEPDRGQSHALNKGFALATGTILGWLNADDYYLPHAVEEGVSALLAHGAGLVYADVTRVNDDGVNPRRIRARRPFDRWTELNVGCGLTSPAVFFTREALDEAGAVDETLHFSMDYDLWLRIAARRPVVGIDAVWAVQRIHDDAKSVAQYESFWPERLRVSRSHGGRLLSPMRIRRHLGQGRLAHLANRAAGALYLLKERRFSTLADRVRALPGDR